MCRFSAYDLEFRLHIAHTVGTILTICWVASVVLPPSMRTATSEYNVDVSDAVAIESEFFLRHYSDLTLVSFMLSMRCLDARSYGVLLMLKLFRLPPAMP